MEKNLEVSLANLKIAQLSFVYKDVEKQASIMEVLFNTPKFTFVESKNGRIKYLI